MRKLCPPTVIVMAKPPVAGRVKTRLIGELSADQAAAIHAAMLDCVLSRVGAVLPGRRVVAWATDVAPAPETPPGWEVVEQGSGDLGVRLERVWREAGGGPVVFLGVDSPDVPAEALEAIGPALEAGEAAIGRAADGGYWTLGARVDPTPLLRGIDWGTAGVYDQTVAAARRAGIAIRDLPLWHDVDEPADLVLLLDRLRSAAEPALAQLRDRLLAIVRADE